jgi:hypothetical protein
MEFWSVCPSFRPIKITLNGGYFLSKKDPDCWRLIICWLLTHSFCYRIILHGFQEQISVITWFRYMQIFSVDIPERTCSANNPTLIRNWLLNYCCCERHDCRNAVGMCTPFSQFGYRSSCTRRSTIWKCINSRKPSGHRLYSNNINKGYLETTIILKRSFL